MIETIAAVSVILVVVMFFKKQIAGLAHMIRGKVEQNLPIEARIDRTVADLRAKRSNIGYNLKNLRKAQKIMGRQVDANKDNKERIETLNARVAKVGTQVDKTKEVAIKIDKNISHLLSEKAYVVAMIEVGNYTNEMGNNVFTDTDDIMSEIEAIEDMMSEE
jgi:methionine synthase II (cobalamin-independent)